MLYQRETGVFCSCQVTWMAAGGMAHLTFILMEGSQDSHLILLLPDIQDQHRLP
jgi:hypothetical protein